MANNRMSLFEWFFSTAFVLIVVVVMLMVRWNFLMEVFNAR